MTLYLGHAANMRRFLGALRAGKLHHGWILSGPRGLGKAGFAFEAARALVDPHDQYHSMIMNGSHPDIIIISRLPKEPPKPEEAVDPNAELKRNINVDQIRELQRKITTKPGLSDKRAIIIDAADDMERGAANALLKTLEEPPTGTYILLVSHATDKLLPTIRSRCQILRFEPLNDADMRTAITHAEPDLDDDNITAMIMAGAGSPGQALEFAGLELTELESAIRKIIQTGDRDNHIKSTLARNLSLKAAHPRYEAFLRRIPQIIAEYARHNDVGNLPITIDAWHSATELGGRAISLSLDKQSVVFQMGSLLANIETHK